MKKVRYGCLSILCAMMIMGLTACGGGDTTSTKASETNRTNSAASGIEATTTDNHKESGSSTGADTSQESTGVIDGLMDGVEDKVEQGVDDMKNTTSGHEETTGADKKN